MKAEGGKGEKNLTPRREGQAEGAENGRENLGRAVWPKPPLTFCFDLTDGALGQRALPKDGACGENDLHRLAHRCYLRIFHRPGSAIPTIENDPPALLYSVSYLLNSAFGSLGWSGRRVGPRRRKRRPAAAVQNPTTALLVAG